MSGTHLKMITSGQTAGESITILTHTIRVLPSLSTMDAVTVPSLLTLVGAAIFPISMSVFEIVVVRVLLLLLFTMNSTVSAV